MYIEDNLDIYNDSAIILNKKTPKKIISWITIMIILTLLFVVFSFIPFNIYKPLVGYVDIIDDSSFLILNINLHLIYAKKRHTAVYRFHNTF